MQVEFKSGDIKVIDKVGSESDFLKAIEIIKKEITNPTNSSPLFTNVSRNYKKSHENIQLTSFNLFHPC